MSTHLFVDVGASAANGQDCAADGVRNMPVKTYLLRVADTVPQDMIIGHNGPGPLLEGQEEESLACPECEHEVTRGVSAATMHALFKPPGRLLYHCGCGAYSAVPAPNAA